MKAKIHPEWYPEAKVTCACGNVFTIGAAVPAFNVEVCSACHPFYTGQMKLLDTAGRVDAFRNRMANSGKKVMSKTAKRKLKKDKKMAEDLSRPESLSDLRTSK